MLNKIIHKVRYLLGIKNDTDYYSQGGEDAIVSKTFNYLLNVQKGFYVDIGAFHPFRHSNTYILYKAGWSGINIDPRPGSKSVFDKYRKGDINVEAGISNKNDTLKYYMLDEGSTMNTFSKENLVRLGLFDQVKKVFEIPVLSFDSLLHLYPQVKHIDYLNIDAEGFEMEILSGINFQALAPSVISIEQNGILTLSDVLESPVCIFLAGKGYMAYAKNLLLQDVSTVFYIQHHLIEKKSI